MINDRGWGKRLTYILYGLILLIFPITLVGSYLAQQQAPMPELYLLTSDPSVIYEVIPDSGAEAAGVLDGDIIRQLNGKPFNPEHLSRQINGLRIGELLKLEIERNGQRFLVEVPLVSVAQVTQNRFTLILLIAFIFWIASAALVWRRFHRIDIRILFFLGQAISIGLQFPYVGVITWFSTTSWVVGVSEVGGMLSVLLLFHFNITFPVTLGKPVQRKYILGGMYGLGMALSAGWIIHNYSLYLPHSLGLWVAVDIIAVGAAAIVAQLFVYFRRATPDGRRRLRVIMVGNLVASVPPGMLYVVPSAALGYPLIPEWLTAVCLLSAPIAYFIATMQHNLLSIDRILNRSVVYAILSLVIIVFCVLPISIIYLNIGNQPGNIIIITVLLLLAAVVFERTRRSIQRMVDRIFYGGWYDYPRVVEKISDTLARSLEWDQLVDILTRQTPAMMSLQGGHLQIEDQFTPELDKSSQPQMKLPLVYEEKTLGHWTVGPRRDGEYFSSDDIRILNTLADQASISVSNMLLVKQMRGQMEEIRASRELLTQIDRQLLNMREEERARLARDLHDGPVQELIGLNIHLGLMSPAGDFGSVENMRDEVKSVINDLRMICAELRPPMLDTLGLGAALRDLVKDWSSQSGIPVNIELPMDMDLRILPENVAVNLYRIAQEALSNIARHAKAHLVRLKVDHEMDQSILTMIIQDDGVGFEYDPAHRSASAGHLGLVNIRERVALIGGELRIDTCPGMGTIICVLYRLVKLA